MTEVQARNPQAFNTLVHRYQAPLIGFFVANTRDRQLAEDLTQETLLRVFDQAWDYLPSGRFRGWMFRIARNLLIDTVRRQSRDALIHAVRSDDEQRPVLDRVADDATAPDEAANQRELTNIVDTLLNDLPSEQRLTFSLFHFAGLPLPEIAQIMDTSLSTTKSRLRLAREKLQSELLARGFQAPDERSTDRSAEFEETPE